MLGDVVCYTSIRVVITATEEFSEDRVITVRVDPSQYLERAQVDTQ